MDYISYIVHLNQMQCNFWVWPHSTVSASQYLVIDEASKCVLLNYLIMFPSPTKLSIHYLIIFAGTSYKSGGIHTNENPLSTNICINENVSYKFADEQIQQLSCTTRTWNMWNSLNLEYQSNRVVCSITGLHIVDWKTNLRFRHLNQRKQNCMSIRSCTGQQRAKMKWEGQSYHVRFFFLKHVMLHLYIFSSAMTCKKLSNNMMDILDL